MPNRPKGMLAAILLAGTVLAAPQEATEPAALRGSTVADVTGIGEFVAVAPDGARLGGVDPERLTAHIVDAATGAVATAPHMGEVAAVLLRSTGQGYWLGLVDGSVVHVADDGSERRIVAQAGQRIDSLSGAGHLLAWTYYTADRGGVIDTRDGTSRFEVEAPLGKFSRLRLTPDGRHVVHLTRHPDHGGRHLAVVRDAHNGEQLAQTETYVSFRGRELALAVDAAFTAARTGMSSWQLQRLDLVALESSVVDPELRGGHYVDLLLSPSGRHLLEGDHEEDGAMLYSLPAGQAPSRRLLGGEGLALGFLAAADQRPELALTTAVRSGLGLSAWSVTDGEPFAADVPFAAGKRISQAGSLLDGRALWLQWSRKGDGGGYESHLEVIALDHE